LPAVVGGGGHAHENHWKPNRLALENASRARAREPLDKHADV
jgi:hypothetical protein